MFIMFLVAYFKLRRITYESLVVPLGPNRQQRAAWSHWSAIEAHSIEGTIIFIPCGDYYWSAGKVIMKYQISTEWVSRDGIFDCQQSSLDRWSGGGINRVSKVKYKLLGR
jgi:hypothetical protein